MMRTRYLLVLAKLQPEQRRMLGGFATTRDLDLVLVEDTNQALLWLDHHDASSLVFDAAIPRAERLCHKARAKRSTSEIPILALTGEPDDAVNEKLYALGASDVVARSGWPAIIARLRDLPAEPAAPPQPKLGRVVVADTDRARCDAIGHVLANAGFELRFASDERVLEYYTTQSDVRLFVANPALCALDPLIERARKASSDSFWIVMSPRQNLEAHTAELAKFGNVAVIKQDSVPDDLLFVANEFLAAHAVSGRSLERALYGTTVLFRRSGSNDDDSGFTYNVSAEGLYVRTLAVPAAESLWLELRPPGANERVRLEGRVVWSSRFKSSGGLAPPGFAVHLTSGLGRDLEIWAESCKAYLESKPKSLRSREVSRAASVNPESAPAPPRPTTEEPAQKPAATSLAEAPRSLEAAPTDERALVAAPEPATRTDVAHGAATIPATRAALAGQQPRRPQRRSAGALAALLFVALAAAGALLRARAAPRQQSVASGSSSPAAGHVPTAPARVLAEPEAPALATAANADAANADAADAPDVLDLDSDASPAAPEMAALARDEAWLVVESRAHAFVYSSGILKGPTNEPLKIHCGTRFLRLGGPKLGDWLAPGSPVVIPCGKVTHLRIEPQH